MNKKILFSILILVALISGCGNQEVITGNVVRESSDEFFCKFPYIEYQKGSCCLDKDDNGICDGDDLKLNEIEEEKVNETCPFECPQNRQCLPVYKDGELSRWACA